MSAHTVLGNINGQPVTVAHLIDLLSTMPEHHVLGERDGTPLTVRTALRELQRTALLPAPVPVEDRITGEEWAEAVFARGEAPYGRCPFCDTAKGVAGCLNMCEYPAAAVQSFNNDMLAHLNRRRGEIRWLEALGGCTCEPPSLHGYAIERDFHGPRCPFAESTTG